jgi:hypothetical protein
VKDLGNGQVALLAQVAEHVCLALKVRIALRVDLGDQRGAVFQLDLVYVADAAAHRALFRRSPKEASTPEAMIRSATGVLVPDLLQ